MTHAAPHAAPHPGFERYRRAQARAASPRAAEAWALTRAAGRLDRALRAGDQASVARALRLNQRLWTVLQADLARPGNRLPAAIKGDVLSLSLFVDRQTVKALSRPGPGAVAPLIEIDRALARGLSRPPSEDTPA